MGFAKAMCNNGARNRGEGKGWGTKFHVQPEREIEIPDDKYCVRVLYKCVDSPEFEGDKQYGFLWYRIDKVVVMKEEAYYAYARSENFDEEFFCGKWTQLPQSEEFRIYDITDKYSRIKEIMANYICPENPDSVYIDIRSVINIKDYRKKIF